MTNRQTDRARYYVCSNRPLLLANDAMRPIITTRLSLCSCTHRISIILLSIKAITFITDCSKIILVLMTSLRCYTAVKCMQSICTAAISNNTADDTKNLSCSYSHGLYSTVAMSCGKSSRSSCPSSSSLASQRP